MSLSFLLILDFEATCEDKVRLYPQEVIEFPSVLLDIESNTVIAEFHSYVKPIHHPILTKFCTELTGITQDKVENAPTFPDIYTQYLNWLETHNLNENNCLIVTCGDWDLKSMLKYQLKLSRISNRPEIFNKWVNIKILFSNHFHRRVNGMPGLLNYFKLKLEGRHHSGIDDCRNITRVAQKMVERRVNFQATFMMPPTK